MAKSTGMLRFIYLKNCRPQVGCLAMNKDRVFNIPQSEEDCMKSKQWFGNHHVMAIITEPSERRTTPIHSGELVLNIEHSFFFMATPSKLDTINEDKDNYERVYEITPDKDVLERIVNRKISEGDVIEYGNE